MPSISSLWQPLLILVIRKGQCQRALFFSPLPYPVILFFGRVRFPFVRLMVIWSWPPCLTTWSPSPSSPPYLSRSNRCSASACCSLGYTNSFHTQTHFRAHRHSILDRNTGVSARFVCLGMHAYYCVSSSNMRCCLIIYIIHVLVCFCFRRFFSFFLWAFGVTYFPLIKVARQPHRTQRISKEFKCLEAQLNGIKLSADCTKTRNIPSECKWYPGLTISIKFALVWTPHNSVNNQVCLGVHSS